MHIHDLVQGTDAWHQFRLQYFGASEAAAMLGLSNKVKRNELLHMKHTGLPREFSDWLQENVLDYGHEVEALARPIVERIIGDDLYPVTCSDGKKSASCDGLTMSETIAFEHKQWNATLAASVANGIVPEEHMPQCQQILMVTKAEKVAFVVSDGTEENMVWKYVYPDLEWFERIDAGWLQFEKDLATYKPVISETKPIGYSPETLPALRLEVTGMVKASNLAEFKTHALAVFASINRDLTTDQHFADAEKTVKWCADVESRLAAAKEHALSQTQSIDQLFKTIDDISTEARNVRLSLDKLVAKRKTEIKESIVLKARSAYDVHLASLQAETSGCWIQLPQPDFAGAIKGLRSLDSMRDALDTLLANAKITADASAKGIRANLAYIKDNSVGYEFLFADKPALAAKKLEDLQLLVSARIAAHKQAEADKLESQRAKIAAEEQAKAEAKVRAEQAALALAATPMPAPPQQQEVLVLGAGTTSISIEPLLAEVRQASSALPSPVPTLTLGKIGTRLGFALTADFLRKIGFEPAAKERSAVLYHESDWQSICAALIRHINQARIPQQKAA